MPTRNLRNFPRIGSFTRWRKSRTKRKDKGSLKLLNGHSVTFEIVAGRIRRREIGAASLLKVNILRRRRRARRISLSTTARIQEHIYIRHDNLPVVSVMFFLSISSTFVRVSLFVIRKLLEYDPTT